MRHLWGYVAVSAAVIATPGPDTVLTVKNALLGGRRAGVFTALGVCTGQATWTLFASVGVTAIVRASEAAFIALRLAGAAYLVYVGGQTLLNAFRSRSEWIAADDIGRRRVTTATAYRQGVISNVSNPKMAAFFVTVLPQFAPGGALASIAALGLVFVALTLLWLCGYAMAVARFSALLFRSTIRRWVASFTGLILVALGVGLFTERARG